MQKQKKLKKPGRRKRQAINGKREHCVTAKNVFSRELIQQKAKDHHLSFYRKGHSINRLYFRSNEGRWNGFYDEIKHLCFGDNFVNCPAHIQKKMVKNLNATAHSKINSTGAKIAKKIFKKLEPDTKKSVAQQQRKIKKAGAGANTNTKLSTSVQMVTSGRQKLISNTLKKCLSHLQIFLSRRKHRRVVHD